MKSMLTPEERQSVAKSEYITNVIKNRSKLNEDENKKGLDLTSLAKDLAKRKMKKNENK